MQIDVPEVFEPFFRPARYKGAFGGRGSGKSHAAGTALVLAAAQRPGLRILCAREIQKSLKESAKRLIEDKIHSLELQGFRILDTEIKTPGGGSIMFQGLQDHTADSVKSLEGIDIAWIEEAQSLSARSLELLRPTIRKPGSELWFTWNPASEADAVDQFLRVNQPDNAILMRANYSDNPFFPQELEEERQHDEKHRPDRYSHIWLGAYEPQAVGAIWSLSVIESGRLTEAPLMDRIVIAVDPAVTSTDVSDEHGIIAAGIGADKRGYILDDSSLRGGPQQWAERAVATYDRWDADAIVVEVNQGGDMVANTIKSVRPNIRIIEVRASKGKHVRAEPISALYGQGRVSHVGHFPQLERQLCQITPAGYEGEGSPDRADALVWALTELFPRMQTKAKRKTNAPRRGGGWMG